MYSVKQKQHAGKTTEPLYKIYASVWREAMCVFDCVYVFVCYNMFPMYLNGQGTNLSSTLTGATHLMFHFT